MCSSSRCVLCHARCDRTQQWARETQSPRSCQCYRKIQLRLEVRCRHYYIQFKTKPPEKTQLQAWPALISLSTGQLAANQVVTFSDFPHQDCYVLSVDSLDMRVNRTSQVLSISALKSLLSAQMHFQFKVLKIRKRLLTIFLQWTWTVFVVETKHFLILKMFTVAMENILIKFFWSTSYVKYITK